MKHQIRPIALERKDHLFAGSDGGDDCWAIVSLLITTAKLDNREPYAYLKDMLERTTNGHPMGQLDDLLPFEVETHTGDTLDSATHGADVGDADKRSAFVCA